MVWCLWALLVSYALGFQRIPFISPSLSPAGLEWDDQEERFVVSSGTYGVLHQVTDNGTLSVLVNDSSLQSTNGLHFDSSFLYVCSNHFSIIPQAQLIAFDRKTWNKAWSVEIDLDVAGGHVCHSITTDTDSEENNIFITDPVQSAILRISSSARTASMWLSNSSWKNLTSITYFPGLNFFVVATSDGFYKIPKNSDGTPGQPYILPISPQFIHPNAVKFLPNGNLIILNGTHVCSLASDDSWEASYIRQCLYSPPNTTQWYSSIALRLGDPRFHTLSRVNYLIFVLNSQNESDAESYDIFRVVLQGTYFNYMWEAIIPVSLVTNVILLILIFFFVWLFSRKEDPGNYQRFSDGK